MKKIFSILMSVFLIVSCIYFPTSPAVERAHAATPWGIDVSEHQGKIDWARVKASGCSFAIIRCGFGQDQAGQDDDYWEYNSSECERLGIPYGVYLYSYAKNTSAAVGEANHVLRLISGKNLSYPVYYDMEEQSQAALGATTLANMASAFCNKIEAAGYAAGVYANTNWWNNYLTSSVFDNWYKWVAQYNSTCTYKGRYEIWQCTDSWSVDGISGRVDGNYQYASVSGSTGSVAESLETDKSTYAQGEEIYVTASTATSGAWVALYGANDTISSSTPSYYWYWVNGTDTEYGHGGTWVRGQSYNIYDAICSHRSLNGSVISGYLPAGKYKVAILYGDYKELMSKTITITDGQAPYMEVSKTTFAVGEDIKVKAYSAKNNAWVGIFPGSNPAYGTGSYIYYYYTSDYNDTYVSLQDKGVQNTSHSYKDLPAGTYTLTLFGDDGYSDIDATKTITIASDPLATDKTSYNVGEAINVTASCSTDGSWVGLYKKGETPGSGTPSMYWYYIKSSADGIDRSGQTINILDSAYYNTERGETIGAGTYTIKVFGDSGYSNVLESIDITVSVQKVEEKRVTVAPTCTTTGSLTVYYTDGTSEVLETYPKLNHQYTSIVTPPSCTEQGYTTYTCGLCKNTYKDNYTNPTGCIRPEGVDACEAANCVVCSKPTPVAAHTPGAAATCKAAQICTVCETVLAPKTAHTPGAASTCEAAQTCEACGVQLAPKAAHTPGAAATCTENQICTVCETVLVKATGHKTEPGTYCTDPHTCTVCGETSPGADAHSPGPAATCTTPQTCTVCTYELAPAKNHDWAEATCTAPKTCKRAGCGVTEGEPISHTTVTDPAKAVGCEDYGLTEGSHCSTCGEVFVEQTVIPATGHDWKAATCTTPQICMNCSTTKGTKLSHSWEEGTVKTKPNCTENGERIDTCRYGCGETNSVLLPAYGHKEIGVVTEPTCDKEGFTTMTCQNDGCSYTRIIDRVEARHNPGPLSCDALQSCLDCGAIVGGVKGHTPGPAATCTTTQNCKDCGAVLKPETGHKPGADATCTTDQTCTVCGVKIEEKTGHTPGPAATCSRAQTCVDCGVQLEPAKEHTPGPAATCTTPQICTVCKKELTGIIGHTPGAPATCTTAQSCTACHAIIAAATGHMKETIPGYAPTCHADGLSDGVICLTCGEVFAAQTVTSKLTHNFVTVTTPATTEADGAIEKKCSHCGQVADAEFIPKVATLKLSYKQAPYNGNKKAPIVYVKDESGNNIDKEYYTVTKPEGRREVGIYTYRITFKDKYEGSHELTLTIKPNYPTMKAPTANKTSVTAKWYKVKKQTSGYQVMAATDKNFTKNVKETFVGSNGTLSKKMTGLKSNKTYYLKVRAYKTVTVDGQEQKVYSDWSGVKTAITTVKPAAPPLLNPAAAKKAVTVKWKKVSKESSGYQVMVATNKAFTKNVKKSFVNSTKTTSKKMSSLQANKTYYVKVRTFKNVKVDGKMTKVYSNWSIIKSAKTK